MFVVILLSVAVILALLFPYTDYPENSIELYWYMPIFIVGMLLAFLFTKIGDKRTLSGDVFVIFGIIGIFIFTPFFRELLWGYEPSGYLQNKYLLIGFLWALIFVGIFCGKYIGEWLDNCRILQKIGGISFSIYLFHYLILDKINLYISNMLIKGLMLIAISVILSVLVNKFIEEPLKTFTGRLVGHKRG